MADPQQIEITVPDEVSSNAADRRSIAQEIIDFIRERTRDGTGARKRGRGYQNYSLQEKPYTSEYAERKGSEFVDLTLSSEMLDNIQYFPSKSSRGNIVVGYRAGSKLNAKVEGNQIGSYGKSANRKKARPFLGITRSDLMGLI